MRRQFAGSQPDCPQGAKRRRHGSDTTPHKQPTVPLSTNTDATLFRNADIPPPHPQQTKLPPHPNTPLRRTTSSTRPIPHPKCENGVYQPPTPTQNTTPTPLPTP